MISVRVRRRPGTLVRNRLRDASGSVRLKMHAREQRVPKVLGVGSYTRGPPCLGLRTGRCVGAGHGLWASLMRLVG